LYDLKHIIISTNKLPKKMEALKVGWIGTGVMGLSMCKHLLNAKYRLQVFNRTPEKAKSLLELGAEWR
jgi:3-hydroxyisobutyrate dehydrogenase